MRTCFETYLEDQCKCSQDAVCIHISEYQILCNTYLSSRGYERIIHPSAKCSGDQRELVWLPRPLEAFPSSRHYFLRFEHRNMRMRDTMPHSYMVPTWSQESPWNRSTPLNHKVMEGLGSSYLVWAQTLQMPHFLEPMVSFSPKHPVFNLESSYLVPLTIIRFDYCSFWHLQCLGGN